MKKNILIVVTISSQFKALLGIIQLLEASDVFKPIIYFDENRHDLSQDIQYCVINNLQYISNRKINTHSVKNQVYNNGVSLRDILNKAIRSNKLISYSVFLINYKRYIANLISTYQIKHVILGADVEPEMLAINQVCKVKNIKSSVYPFSLSSYQENLGASKANSSLTIVNVLEKIFYKTFFRKWTIEENNILYLSQEKHKIIATCLIGLSPVKPWVYIGGKSDFVFIESKFAGNYYKQAGIDPNKFVEIGAPYLNVINNIKTNLNLKLDLIKRLNIESNKKIIVCALPPVTNDLNEKYNDSEEYQTYESMIRGWIEPLLFNENIQLVVNPHPRSNQIFVSKIPQFKKTIISTNDIAELISICDLFVANASATIRFALAANKPVIDYDMQRFGYSNYSSIPSVIYVSDHEEYANICNELINKIVNNELTVDTNKDAYYGDLKIEFKKQFFNHLKVYS